jgi:hypothetical protein
MNGDDMKTIRRYLLAYTTLIGLTAASTANAQVEPQHGRVGDSSLPTTQTGGVYNVITFGASSDGQNDVHGGDP